MSPGSRLESSLTAGLDQAKADLQGAFQAEKASAAAKGALGSSGLFIAYQVRAQEIAGELVDRMLVLIDALSARYDLDGPSSHAAAIQVFDQYVQFVVQIYEEDNRLQSQTRRTNAPPIHSSLFRIPRQQLSASVPERLARAPLSRRLTQLIGKLRGAN